MNNIISVETDYPFCVDEPDFTLHGEIVVKAATKHILTQR